MQSLSRHRLGGRPFVSIGIVLCLNQFLMPAKGADASAIQERLESIWGEGKPARRFQYDAAFTSAVLRKDPANACEYFPCHDIGPAGERPVEYLELSSAVSGDKTRMDIQGNRT